MHSRNSLVERNNNNNNRSRLLHSKPPPPLYQLSPRILSQLLLVLVVLRLLHSKRSLSRNRSRPQELRRKLRCKWVHRELARMPAQSPRLLVVKVAQAQLSLSLCPAVWSRLRHRPRDSSWHLLTLLLRISISLTACTSRLIR